MVTSPGVESYVQSETPGRISRSVTVRHTAETVTEPDFRLTFAGIYFRSTLLQAASELSVQGFYLRPNFIDH